MKQEWYQFKLKINRNLPSETQVIFPLDPENFPPSGTQIHNYLLQQGLFKQRRADGFYYLAEDEEVNLTKLEDLYFKFKPEGATIERSHHQNLITREEFEEFREQAKKLLGELEQELQRLEQEEDQE